MNSRSIFAALLLVLPVAGAGIGSAAAETIAVTAPTVQLQTIETGFPFAVGDKTLPAGKYIIEQEAPDLLVFRPADGKGQSVEAPVITRLAMPVKPLLTPDVVFDDVNGSYFISEVWLPGTDGFLLGGIKVEHRHRRVEGSKK